MTGQTTQSRVREMARRASDAGQVLIMTGTILTILFGVMGISIDAGYLYYQKRRMQVAADSGALAAALEFWQGNSSGYVAAAHTDSQLNGFHSSNGSTVTVNRPPTQGPRAGHLDFVEVVVSQDSPAGIMALLGLGSTTVRARAVAGIIYTADACIWILDPTSEKALLIESGSYVDSRCGIRVNSNSWNALTVHSDGHLDAKTIEVVGNYTSTSGSTVDVDGPNDVDPPLDPPTVGVSSFGDPMFNVGAPSFSTACNSSDPDYRGTNVKTSSTTATLYPGTYCGGLGIESGSNVTLAPGTYVMYGGGFRTSSGSSVNGNGVTIYLTHNGPLGGCGDYKGLLIDSNSLANLRAPDNGPMEGMLFFQDRTIDRAMACDMSRIESNVSSTLAGTMYFPTTTLGILSNTIVISEWALIIANKLIIQSGSRYTNNFDTESSAVRPQMKRPALVE